MLIAFCHKQLQAFLVQTVQTLCLGYRRVYIYCTLYKGVKFYENIIKQWVRWHCNSCWRWEGGGRLAIWPFFSLDQKARTWVTSLPTDDQKLKRGKEKKRGKTGGIAPTPTLPSAVPASLNKHTLKFKLPLSYFHWYLIKFYKQVNNNL